jgi:hypothetical protein
MNDRPTAPELLAAVRQYLESDVLPLAADGRLKFQTLIAINVLAVVERELRLEEDQLAWECEWLAEVCENPQPISPRLAALRESVARANAELCERIRRGEFDEGPRLLALARQVRRTVERKLEVANPKYLASFVPQSETPQP